MPEAASVPPVQHWLEANDPGVPARGSHIDYHEPVSEVFGECASEAYGNQVPEAFGDNVGLMLNHAPEAGLPGESLGAQWPGLPEGEFDPPEAALNEVIWYSRDPAGAAAPGVVPIDEEWPVKEATTVDSGSAWPSAASILAGQEARSVAPERVSAKSAVPADAPFDAGPSGEGSAVFSPTSTGSSVDDMSQSPGSFDDIFAPVGGLKRPKAKGSGSGTESDLANAGSGNRKGGGTGRGIVGVLGDIFLTVGVFLLLFVVWQLFITDLLAERDQVTFIKTVEQQEGWQAAKPQYGTKHTEDPPVMAKPELYDQWGFMYVPRFGVDYKRTVTEGADRKTILNPYGIGHYETTALPGEVGNFSLAGHRTTYGKPFNLAADLKEGDPLIIETNENYYVYYVTTYDVIEPGQGEVIHPVPNDLSGLEVPTERFITLTTCHPMYSAAQRYVVWGKLAYWTPKSEGLPPDLPEASW